MEEKIKRTETMHFRVTVDEKKEIENMARRKGLPVADCIRRTLNHAASIKYQEATDNEFLSQNRR